MYAIMTQNLQSTEMLESEKRKNQPILPVSFSCSHNLCLLRPKCMCYHLFYCNLDSNNDKRNHEDLVWHEQSGLYSLNK